MKDVFRKINYILDRKQKWELVFLLLCMVVNAAFELLGIGVIYPVIDLAMNPDAISTNAVYSRIYDFLGFTSYRGFVLCLIGGIVAVFVLKTVFLIFFRMMQLRFRHGNARVIAVRLLGTYMTQPYTFFAKNNSSRLIRNINSDPDIFFRLVFDLLQLVVNGFTALCIGSLMFATNPTVTLALVAVISVLVAAYFLAVRRRIKRYGMEFRTYGADSYQWLSQSIGGIKETKVLRREQFFIGKYDESSRRCIGSLQKSELMISLPNDVLLSVCIATVMVMLGAIMLGGEDVVAQVSNLSVFALAAFRIFPCVSGLSAYFGDAIFARPSMDAMYEVLHEAGELRTAEAGAEVDAGRRLPFRDAIELRDVSFGYEDAPKPVFEHAGIIIPKNRSVAFVGPSGAGKTTVADIILGLLDPSEGAVLVDGEDIKDKKRGWLLNIGYIPQSIYLSDDTIRNNIAFGLSPKEIDDERVWKAAGEAQIAEYIRSLPDGLDTYIGERGIRMSGGQRQRVGIARALYNDPEVLVLDEATSALDTETEAAVMEAIDGLSGRKTLLIIAHRLTTIRNCGIVYEIKDGKVRKIK